MTGPVLPVRDEAALRVEVAARSARLRRRHRMALALPTAVVAGILLLATVAGGGGDEARVRVTDRDGDRTTLPAPKGEEAPGPASGRPASTGATLTAPGRQPTATTTPAPAGGSAATSTTTTTIASAPTASLPRMAFVRGNGVYEQRVDGTGLRRLASGALESPTWAPDAGAVAFSEPGAVSGVRRIVVLDLATGDKRRLLDDVEVSSTDPAWSPDGARLAVTRRPRVESGAPGAEAAVWTVDVRTGEGRRVAAGSRPAWSPDGRLLFDCDGGLCTAPADGSSVAAVPGTDDLTDAAWSPDGAWLAAVDDDLRLVVLRPDGRDRRALGVRVVDGPAWFPDGGRIAFAIERTTTTQGIWSIAPDGGGRRQHTDGGNDRDPSLTSG